MDGVLRVEDLVVEVSRRVRGRSLGTLPTLRQQRARLEGLRREADVHGACLEPHLLALHHARRDAVLAGVLVAPEIAEQPADLAAGRAAEEVG